MTSFVVQTGIRGPPCEHTCKLSLKVLTAAEKQEFKQKFPKESPTEHDLQWIERYLPRQSSENETDWLKRVVSDPDWGMWLTRWPPVEITIEPRRRNDETSNVQWIGGGAEVYIGGTGPTSKLKERGILVDNVMRCRLDAIREKQAEVGKKKAQLYPNPAGVEMVGRWTSHCVNYGMLYGLFRHFGLSATLDYNMGNKSWYYTCGVKPSAKGAKWGAKIEAGTDFSRINNAHWLKWYVVPNTTFERMNVMVRCWKLEGYPDDDRLTDDGETWAPRCHPGTTNIMTAGDHYSAVIQLAFDGNGTRFQGWLPPKQILDYPRRTRHETDGTRSRDVDYFEVPIEDFRPMSEFLNCLEGFDSAKLIEQKRMFT